MEAVNDDALIKSINLELLMHTRSEDVQSRTFALTCSESLWRAHGGKLLGTLNTPSDLYTALSELTVFAGFVAETTTFITECAEDDNDLVVKESHRLKDAVESVAGKINGL
jgi:U3 small nucleolar RNA-associated protein 10